MSEYVINLRGEREAWHSEHPLFWCTVGCVAFRIRNWLWLHGGQKLYWETYLKRPPIKKWWIRWCNPGFDPCDTCGYVWDWGQPDGFFKFERGGDGFNGEYTTHWFEGVQTCPRCRSEFAYGDSD